MCHVSSSLRPDIFIYSFLAKRALILELTCPNEDRFETSHVLKEKKYLKLRDSIIANGFDCNIFTIEVGVRGNICMDQLNIWTRHIGSPLAPTKALFCECTRIARQCSYVLFQTRNLPTWHSRPLMRSIKEEPATASFIKDGKEIFPVEEVKIHKVTKLKTIEKLTIERSWLEKCFISYPHNNIIPFHFLFPFLVFFFSFFPFSYNVFYLYFIFFFFFHVYFCSEVIFFQLHFSAGALHSKKATNFFSTTRRKKPH